MSLLLRGARVVVGDGSPALARADVRIVDARIDAVEATLVPLPGERTIEVAGRVLLPGFVDAHTHALWAGDRLEEFEQRQRGATYLEILKAGGGIWSTVRSVRAASQTELTERLQARLEVMLREGTTTVEVKSGYGLSLEHELKMLRAIRAAAQGFRGTVVATALLGHALDPADPDFVRRTVEQTLPAIHEEFPEVAVDAYCEQGAFSLEACRQLLLAAQQLGHPLRLHADQFHRLGAVELALELGIRSLDHLEATPPEALERLARAGVFGVMLPASGFHVDGRYANARAFLDAGGKLVLASNCNPGTAPTSSMPLVIALAVRHLRLTAAEAITATTQRAAELLGFADRGAVRVGQRADLLLLRHADERQLGYELGGDPVDHVVCGGELVK
ncbi:MAG TPA: imidazolonepropionase [Polyangiaceae bacterium]|nr:imidazolonepropionase [Polyangiaceae bacterium]